MLAGCGMVGQNASELVLRSARLEVAVRDEWLQVMEVREAARRVLRDAQRRRPVQVALVQLARRVLQRGVERALGRELEHHEQRRRASRRAQQPHDVRVVLPRGGSGSRRCPRALCTAHRAAKRRL